MPGYSDDKQDRAFCAHMEDLFSSAMEQYHCRFSSFLDLHQQKLVRRMAAAFSSECWMLFGGHDEAERVMLGICPPYEQLEPTSFPIIPVSISFRKEDMLGHRDLLGAMLSLGVKRETVGDILVDTGLAVCFLTEPAARIVEQELCKVGRCGVKTARGLPLALPPARRYEPCSVQISSLRLDCFTASLCNISRAKAAQMILSRLVQIDGAITDDISHLVEEGAVLSLRGYGKFLFESIERTTRGGRLAVLCKKYV